jgi:peptidoglycan/LPS O-acetylase OafA/YrhL
MSGVTERDRPTSVWLPRRGYIPALDGLRAFAVVAVLLYHGDVKWMRGGFLGVDVFFVISGYLITSLLLADWHEHGRVRFGRFYVRRARRLLPALFLMLGVVSLYSLVFLPDTMAELRGAVIASVAYVENWYLIFHHVSYFVAAGRPSLLRHVWSLAVEEQFYLVWPLVFSFLLTRWGKRRKNLLLAILGSALASAVLMAVLYNPYRDPSHVYFGTDTRASTMLIGAALAIIWTPWRLTRHTGRNAPLVLDSMAVVGIVGVVWFFHNAGEFDPWMYRGGFLVLALLSALLIAAAVHPASRLAPLVFGFGICRWIGVRSYGIYLWHWPVFMVTRPHADIPLTGTPLLALRITTTFVFAALSYKYVEAPIRSGAIGRHLTTLRGATGERRHQLATRLVTVSTALALGMLVITVGLAEAGPAPRPRGMPDQITLGALPPPAVSTTPASPASEHDSITSNATRGRSSETTTTTSTTTSTTATATPTVAAPATAPATTPRFTGRVTAIGDSVMLGAAETLADVIGRDRTFVDAAVNRQFSTGVDLLQTYRDTGQLGDVVIVQLGTNGPVSPEDFDRLMSVLSTVPKVLVVNLKVPRWWETEVNDLLADGVKHCKNAVLVDWHNAAKDRPELFWDDGYHLNPQGQQFYADVIARNL